MKLDRTTTKRLIFLIVLIFLLYATVQHPEGVAAGAQFLFGIVSPFFLGAAMAFILNVPMRALEQRLFKNQGNMLKKVARPLSLLITLLLVILVILLLLLVVLLL